jgi:hypothetical protein
VSTRYFITPYAPIHWKDENASGMNSTLVVDFQDFSRAARLVWLSYETYPNCSWAISLDDVEISGSFRGKGNQILALERPGHLFNRFVAWYRTYISSGYQLFLFAEGSWDSLELTDGITDKDVGNFTGYL